jgi:hypothetical protein
LDESLHLSDSDNSSPKTLPQEIKSFIEMPKADVTTFYTRNSHNYTHLSQVVPLILSIPATSVPCERLFSHAGFQVRINSIHDVEILIFIPITCKRFAI